MDLLQDLKISLLNFNFLMIFIIHKMLVLLKNNLNYLKDSFFECFFKQCNRLLIFQRKKKFRNRNLSEIFSNEKIIKLHYN